MSLYVVLVGIYAFEINFFILLKLVSLFKPIQLSFLNIGVGKFVRRNNF